LILFAKASRLFDFEDRSFNTSQIKNQKDICAFAGVILAFLSRSRIAWAD
jgi:hypothetical protein